MEEKIVHYVTTRCACWQLYKKIVWMKRATDVSLMLADCKQFRKNLTLGCI